MPDPAATPPRPRRIGLNVEFEQIPVIPHETTPPPRPRSIPGRGRGRSCDPAATPSRTNKFTASTCRKCGAITITGTTYGLPLHLEPNTLDDHSEYQALLNNVPTYNLLPDRTAQRRHLEHIRAPSRHPRHAQHTCGTQYGTNPRPPSQEPTVTNPDGPPPF